MNICQQTGMNESKQKQIQDFVLFNNIDILMCQEINIDDESFSDCQFLSSNFSIIQNNALNKYGTATFISNRIEYNNVKRDTEGRIQAFDMGDITLSNVYLHSGNDKIMKDKREEAIALSIPQILQDNKENGLCIGDWNCITDVKDATKNPAEKISKSLIRLIAALKWKDAFRYLYPNDLVYSREYVNVYGSGATRIDRGYFYGDIDILEANYVGIPFSDHMGLIIKFKVPHGCIKAFTPRGSPLFKANPEVVKDKIFQAELKNQFEIWNNAKIASNIPTLDWWDRTVKPGIRKILRARGRKLKHERKGKLNLLQMRQAYLVRKIQDAGKQVRVRGPVQQHLSELKAVQLEIQDWYNKETEKVKIQSKVRDLNDSENVRLYHHENHRKHIRKTSILKLETDNGEVLSGHIECLKHLEKVTADTFGVPPDLDNEAQTRLLNEVEKVFTLEDNNMMNANPSKQEVKKCLWGSNANSSPGSDGITFLLYRECWEILGDALTEVCVCLYNGVDESASQSLSLMMFATKPKKGNSIKVKDKRTLSLLNCDKKLYDLIQTNRLKSISTRGVSRNQLATGDDRRIYHGINAARDAIQQASNRNENCGLADMDLVQAFNLVSIHWICKVLLAKGLSTENVRRISNQYKNAKIRVVVNNEVGGEIKIKRCVRQGAPSSMILFLYNVDPVLVYLEKRLTGISLYKLPVYGPVNEDLAPLPCLEEKFTVKGYADDIKPAIKSL